MEIFHFNCVLLGMELHKSPCCFGLSTLWLNCWSTRPLWIRFRPGNIIKNTIRNNFETNIIVEISHVGLNEKNEIILTAGWACGRLWLFLIVLISAFCEFSFSWVSLLEIVFSSMDFSQKIRVDIICFLLFVSVVFHYFYFLVRSKGLEIFCFFQNLIAPLREEPKATTLADF